MGWCRRRASSLPRQFPAISSQALSSRGAVRRRIRGCCSRFQPNSHPGPALRNGRVSRYHRGPGGGSLHPAALVYRPMRMANPATVSQPAQPSVPHPTPEAEEIYRRWIQFLDDEFTRHKAPERRAEIVRDQLYQIYLGRPHGGKLNLTLTSELPGNVVSLSLDPENVTLEAGHFGDVDRAEVQRAQTVAVVLADVRPLPHRTESLAGTALSLHAGPAPLRPHGQRRAHLPRRRPDLRLQAAHRGWRDHPAARAAERSRRHHHRQECRDRFVCPDLLAYPFARTTTTR